MAAGLFLAIVVAAVAASVSLRGRARVVAVGCLTFLALVALPLLWALNLFSAQQLVEGYAAGIARATQLDPAIVKALTALAVVPVAFGFASLVSLSHDRRRLGAGLLASLLALYYVAIWAATRNQLVTVEGRPLRCFVVTEQGVVYRSIDYVGIDPETGLPCEPVRPEIIGNLKRVDVRISSGEPFRSVDPAGLAFFSPVTRRPIVWFHRGAAGELEFYDTPGFHPSTGEPLLPVTKEIVTAWQERVRAQAEQAAQARADQEAREADARRLAEIERQEGIRRAEEESRAATAEAERQAELRLQAAEAEAKVAAVRAEQARLDRMRGMLLAGSGAEPSGVIGLLLLPSRPDDELDRIAADRLAELVGSTADPSLTVVTGLFAAPFVAEGHFSRVMAGDLTALRETGALDRVGRIVLGVVEASCSAGGAVAGVTSWRVALTAQAFLPGGAGESVRLSETGAAFQSQMAAARGAELLVQRNLNRIVGERGGRT